MTAVEIEKKIKEKRQFQAHEDGSFYKLPAYKVVVGKGLEPTGKTIDIPIVRGTRIGKDGKEFLSIQGTTHETLITMIIQDLEEKHALLPSAETEEALACLNEALNYLEWRQRDRMSRKVISTDKK